MSKKKPLKIKIRDTIEVHENGVYESVVVRSGNGAVINFYKRFIDEEVIVIVKDKLKNEKETLLSTDPKVNKRIAEKWEKDD